MILDSDVLGSTKEENVTIKPTTDLLAESGRLGNIGRRLDVLADQGASGNPIDRRKVKEIADEAWSLREQMMARLRREENAKEQAKRVQQRMHEAWQYIERMYAERQGWGEDAMRGVGATTLSWTRARALYLDGASEVWCDGREGLSFGGMLVGNIEFGCIAREERDLNEAQPLGGWKYPAIRWTFHS